MPIVFKEWSQERETIVFPDVVAFRAVRRCRGIDGGQRTRGRIEPPVGAWTHVSPQRMGQPDRTRTDLSTKSLGW